MGIKKLFRRLVGFWIRWQACKMASRVMQSRPNGDEAITPLLWSLTVFFEGYIRFGSEETQKDFGPKEAVQLEAVRRSAGE